VVIANDVSAPDAGFAVDTNRVIAVDAAGATPLPFGVEEPRSRTASSTRCTPRLR
jgi:hypothetical protein